VTASFEVLLIAGIIGFYVFDSALILYFNEVLFIRRANQWSFSLPDTRWQALGRYLYIPNPLSPDQVLLRCHWSPSESMPATDPSNRETVMEPYVPLQYLIVVLWVLLLIASPVALLAVGAGWFFLGLILLAYMVAIGMVVYAFRHRVRFGMSMRDAAKLGFDSLVCIPFAINLVRKISLQHSPGGDVIELGKRLLPDDIFHRFVRDVGSRVDEELAIIDDRSPRYQMLKSYQARLGKLVP